MISDDYLRRSDEQILLALKSHEIRRNFVTWIRCIPQLLGVSHEQLCKKISAVRRARFKSNKPQYPMKQTDLNEFLDAMERDSFDAFKPKNWTLDLFLATCELRSKLLSFSDFVSFLNQGCEDFSTGVFPISNNVAKSKAKELKLKTNKKVGRRKYPSSSIENSKLMVQHICQENSMFKTAMLYLLELGVRPKAFGLDDRRFFHITNMISAIAAKQMESFATQVFLSLVCGNTDIDSNLENDYNRLHRALISNQKKYPHLVFNIKLE